MKRKQLLVGLILLIIFICFFVYSVFWGHFTTFYSDCAQVQVGMTSEEVGKIMQKYMSDPDFNIGREGALWGEGLYISSDLSNHQCNLKIRNGMVTDIDAVFD